MPEKAERRQQGGVLVPAPQPFRQAQTTAHLGLARLRWARQLARGSQAAQHRRANPRPLAVVSACLHGPPALIFLSSILLCLCITAL